MKVKGYKKHILVLTIILTLLSALSFIALNSNIARAQVPITVWGYVKYPNGRPAAGAHVRVVADGASKSTTTDSSGKYKVDLTVSKVPVTVKVYASINSYKGSASKSNVKGVVRIDVTLHKVKKSTSLTISVPRTEYSLGEIVTVKGKIKPPMSVSITIHVIDPSGKDRSVTVRSKGDGTFSYSFKVDMLGKWRIYAVFPGSKDYKSSRSNTITIYVKTGIKLTFNVTTKVVEKVCKLVIEGITDPPVSDVKVSIYVSFDNGTTWSKIGEATVSNGKFTFEYTLYVYYGHIMVKVYFPGTAKYAPCEIRKATVVKVKKIEKLEKVSKELEKKVEELTKKVEALEEERKNLTETKKVLEETQKKLQEQISTLTSKMKELNVTLSRVEAEKAKLQSEVQSLREELEKAEKAKAELELEVAKYRKKAKLYPIITLIVGIGVGLAIGLTIAKLSKKTAKKREKEKKRGEK